MYDRMHHVYVCTMCTMYALSVPCTISSSQTVLDYEPPNAQGAGHATRHSTLQCDPAHSIYCTGNSQVSSTCIPSCCSAPLRSPYPQAYRPCNPGFAHYVMSKGAIVAFAKVVGLRVCDVCVCMRGGGKHACCDVCMWAGMHECI